MNDGRRSWANSLELVEGTRPTTRAFNERMVYAMMDKANMSCLLLVCARLLIYGADAWNTNYLLRHRQRLQVSRLCSSSSNDAFSVETIHGSWNATVFGSTQCWGQRPLLMRTAFMSTEPLPSWEDIVDLACNEDEEEPVTSRLIQHHPGTLDTFQVQFGPFFPKELEKSLENNEKSTSTLVVNDVDRWIPAVSDWMDVIFEFLPRWRRDDAQVSLAAAGGGIGPHVDNYDVFLIQASGSRNWEVGLDEISVHDEFANLVSESQVRILNTTMPRVKLHLEAGDCLYLPPRILHCGTSTSDDCVTLSVGCRAPSAADVLSRMAECLVTSTAAAAVERYTDLDLLQSNDKSLSPRVKGEMKQLLHNLVDEFVEDDDSWDNLVGRLATEPNRPVLEYPTPLYAMDDGWKDELGIWADANAALESILSGTGVLRRAEGVSFAWSTLPASTITKYRLYAQGKTFELEDDGTSTASLLCQIANGPPLDGESLDGFGIHKSANTHQFLLKLLEEGFLYGDEEVE